MEIKTKKIEVTKEAANEFCGAFQAMKREERGKAPYKLGIPFRAALSRNCAALQPLSDEVAEAYKEAVAQEEAVRVEKAAKDADGNPIELPTPAGNLQRYHYDCPVSEVNEAIKALGYEKQLKDLAAQSEKISLQTVVIDDFPEDVEHHFEAFKLMISNV